MGSNAQPVPEKVVCSVCGKTLDPCKPLGAAEGPENVSRSEGFYCLDCWFRELRKETAESLIARALDRVLLE